MRNEKGTNEKRTLEVMDDFSEELERVIQNPDLLPNGTYDDMGSKDFYTVDNYDNRSTHLNHHRSLHRHHSTHSHSSYSNSGGSSYSSHHRSVGTGRLASHHRSRHHQPDGMNSNFTKNTNISALEYNNFQESIDVAQVSEDFYQQINKSYVELGDYNKTEKPAYAKSFYHEIESYPAPAGIISGEVKHEGIKSDYYQETSAQNSHANVASVGTANSGENIYRTKDRSVSTNCTKRIASRTSGSESSKREAEKMEEALNGGKTHKRKSRRRRRKKIGLVGVFLRILIVLLVIGIIAVGSLVYLRAHGESSMKKPVEEVQIVIPRDDSEVPEIEEVEDDGKAITYRGEKYRYNENISTILFMGTDRTIVQQESTETAIGTNGQADTIILCVVDNTNQKISFINVNRDTMVPVSEYTPDGDYAGDKVMQICLAYSYGADNVQSSERMVEAVSKYLYGMPINAYCRMSYDGIPTLNDAVGGVTVIVPEDMTSVNSEWMEGSTITLHGEETAAYMRWRNRNTVHTNELRMSRQKQYLKAFMKQTIEQVRADLTLPLTLYSIATDYMTTDITTSQVTYLSSKILEYGVKDDAIFSIPGESVDGEEHVEFYTDDKGLYDIILNTFYNKVG